MSQPISSVVDISIPQQFSLDSLITYGYWVIFFFVLLPLGGWVKRYFSKDPVLEEVKRLYTIIADYSKTTDVLNQSIATSLQDITAEQRVTSARLLASTTYGIMDETLTVDQFHSHINFAMLRMISLYHERLRKNGIKIDRHVVITRYGVGAADVASRLYRDLSKLTCAVNSRKLSGFLNGKGAEMLFQRIADELFQNHHKKVVEENPSYLTEEDIESALDRFTSIVVGIAQEWIHNDKYSLDAKWDDFEDRLHFLVDSDDIEWVN